MKPPALDSFNPEASAKLGPLLVIPVIAFSPSPMPKARTSFFHLILVAVYYFQSFRYHLGFPGGSDGRESACNVGDLGSIPELGRSP